MAMKPIARSYWRLIRTGNRTFTSVPDSVKDDVKLLVRTDMEAGVITPEQYKDLIGEAYVM